ncbi:hypothetical protein BCR43DRAFT_449977 [Syncephalastrum racemosum]|uniref:MYND-type domain-containing protein n=1 Tax=Syncephalastrum racemosum TaxID=13706 RepID=A0A1X2HTH3_SYNRA|nr:hypothetical protein BCR43DRAFT_449977 [Syncephalastrum racemosum]
MREPNLCFPGQNRAAVCITSALYDRRALDCTATLPMINSLTHLAYLTSTSPRIRDILVVDGGLEKLVRILSQQQNHADMRHVWKWSLAFQCVVNIGVRGTEQIRTRVVEAGMIPVVLRVLENFLRALEAITQEKQKQQQQQQQVASSADGSVAEPTNSHSLSCTTTNTTTPTVASSTNATTAATTAASSMIPSHLPHNHSNLHQHHQQSRLVSTSTCTSASSSSSSMHPARVRTALTPNVRRSTFPYLKIDPAQRRRSRLQRDPASSRTFVATDSRASPSIDNVYYREEDILMSLQLLAYLSKYPHIRDLFLTAYDRNVFSVVEKFAHRLHPGTIQYWSGVIMRNACRKDDTRGGIRRCANMHCGKWEKQPREFAKCRRCRKAKYCSKACQSTAWSAGHRWWCVERQPSSATAPVAGAVSSAVTAAAAAATARAAAATTAPHPSADNFTQETQVDDDDDHTPAATNVSAQTNILSDDHHRRPESMRERGGTVVVNEIPTPPGHAHSESMTMIERNTEASSAGESSESRGLLVDMGVGMEL